MESVFPAMSVARTWKVCGPSPSVGRMSGVMQGLYAPLSTEHSNVAPASFEEKPKVGVALELGSLGFAPIVVFGAIVSIWIVFVPTPVMLPTLSSAIHLTVVVPSAETLNDALPPATSVPTVTVSVPSIVGSLPSVV